jgi:hypothetical protein
MDSLIKSLEVFGVTQDKKYFNNSIDYIFNNLSIKTQEQKEEDTDSDKEWELLKNNYSKIKYVYQLLNHYNYTLSKNFFDLVKVFTDSLDNTTLIYMDLIKQEMTDDDELKYLYKDIADFFNKSLNTSDHIQKINYLIKAYDLLIPIVEDFRKEKYVEKVDKEFINLYNPCSKRQKK